MQGAKPETTHEFSDTAKDLLLELQAQALHVVNQRPELEALPTAAPAETFSCPAKVVFTGLAIWERVQICCSSQPAVRTTTDIWGPTLAIGGISWGTCWFNVQPSDLPSLGDLTIQVNIASVAVQISWWRDGAPIGTFVGGGVGLGTGVLGGTCKFENGTC